MRWLQYPFVYLALFCFLELGLNGRMVKVFRWSDDEDTNIAASYTGLNGSVHEDAQAKERALMEGSDKKNTTSLPRSPTVIVKPEEEKEEEQAETSTTTTSDTPEETPKASLGEAEAWLSSPLPKLLEDLKQKQEKEQPEQPEQPQEKETPKEQSDSDTTALFTRADLAQARPYKTYKPTGPETWFYLHSSNEGMSNWKNNLAQLLTVARTLNVTVVEPCVARGMLRTCNASDPGITTGGEPRKTLASDMVRLRDVYELQTMLDYYPKIVPYDEFVQHYDPTMDNLEKICASRWIKSEGHICKAQKIDNYMMASFIKPMDNMIRKTRNDKEHSVVEIYDMWRWGIGKHAFGCKKRRCYNPHSLDPGWKAFERTLSFPEHQVTNVNRMLERLLPNKERKADGNLNFGAIQWRPEVKTIPYIRCAKMIIDTRDTLAEMHGIPKENFLLMTPLSERKEMSVWDGVGDAASGHQEDVDEAFAYMRKNGMQRLEDVHSINDGSLPAVWDFVTAQLATTYSTCTGCRGYCTKCNYSGISAKFSVSNRNRYRSMNNLTVAGTDHKCWPEKTKFQHLFEAPAAAANRTRL